jgi:hypothetical protein
MTTPNDAGRFGSSVATPHVITVGGTECVVRVTHLSPIADVLGFEPEMVTTGPVSSRALFYAAE